MLVNWFEDAEEASYDARKLAQGVQANLEHLEAKTLETRTKAIKNLAEAEDKDLRQFATGVEPSQSLRTT